MSYWEIAIERASTNTLNSYRRVMENYPYLKDLAIKVRKAKEEVLKNLDYYIDLTLKSVEKTGGKGYYVNNAEEAREVIGKIVGKGKLVVMGKSMVAYEVGLRKYLESIGNEVYETDLGEFLIQLADEPPSHIIGPAIHMTKERVEQLLREKVNKNIKENASHEELANVAREFLYEKFIKANVGITGANAVAADTGSIVLVENEGNIRKTTVLPPVHIAITGIDKILPTLELAIAEALVQSGFNGLYPPTYINVTSGPSSTGDIELHRVSPAQGPKEFHLVLLDNGRKEAAKDDVLWEALLCVRCGQCHFHCPVYRVLDGKWGDPPYSGPMGAMWSYVVYKDPLPATLCTHSGGCKEVCPMEINIPRVLDYIKWKYNRKSS
ncbi:MAG: lactate utilization protein B [Sulfolobaceae archaeon]|nr:lactate utilization protein B [Sulfolobaceae archaeon]